MTKLKTWIYYSPTQKEVIAIVAETREEAAIKVVNRILLRTLTEDYYFVVDVDHDHGQVEVVNLADFDYLAEQGILPHKEEKRQFHIYHSTGPDSFMPVAVQPRVYVGFVDAYSIEDAYKKSQNGEDPWNMATPCRSTSVGDVIQCNEGFFMVCGTGFRLLNDMSKNESEQNGLESNMQS